MALSESGPGGVGGAMMISGPVGSRKPVKAKRNAPRGPAVGRKGGKQNLYTRPRGRK